MQITPDRFFCVEHQEDLTELVQEELTLQIPAAFRPPQPKEFRVFPTCPGAGTPHEVPCAGTIIA